jgi:MazG family protein
VGRRHRAARRRPPRARRPPAAEPIAADRDQALKALERLGEITRRLRLECPWDREQDERSIVPHTVEEAYELADAAERGDDEKLLDELGDVLFQIYFLALLLEERGAGSLAEVAEGMSEKLIRRHPHVFGEAQASRDLSTPGRGAEDVLSSDEVLRNWDQIKRDVEGRGAGEPFADVPENLPALLYARKIQRRAASAGLAEDEPVGERLEGEARDAAERWVGETLFALVGVARRLRVDPELALRAAAERARAEALGRESP